MSQVGKPHWNLKVKERIDEVFYDLLVKVRSREQAEEFCRLILTPTERTNLPRRLGILILLRGGIEQRTIAEVMHVSIATVGKQSASLKEKGLKWVGKFIEFILAQDKPNRVETKPRPSYLGGKIHPVKYKPDVDLPY